MIKFFVEAGTSLRQGTTATVEKAAEFLKLVFEGRRAFVVEDTTVRYAQNMNMEEAEGLNPFKPTQPVVTAPLAPAAAVVKNSVPKAKKKVAPKKVVVKSKVKPKSKAKVAPKKTKLKTKPKAKAKKPIKVKAKNKAKARR